MKRDRRVFLIDDDRDVREALTLLLATCGFVVEPFANAQDFLERSAGDRAGCLVTDIRMPGLSGLQLLERLATESDRLPVVVITGHGDVASCRRAFRGGAVDFLTKPVDEHALIEAIEAGLMRLDAVIATGEEVKERRVLLARLSPREREVLDMVAMGWTTKEIAGALSISPRTVESHRAKLAEKLGTASVAEMVRLVVAERDA